MADATDGYLNSRSMATPGIAGATTTMIADTLAIQFGLQANYTALFFSMVIGTLVLSDKTVPAIQRIILYIVNSLIIFTVAMGVNTAGVVATTQSEQQGVEPITRGVETVKDDAHKPFFHPWY